MKKLTFLFLFAVTFAAAHGQVKQSYPQYGGIWKRLQPDSAFKLPMAIVGIKDANAGLDTGQIRYDKTDSTAKVYTGSQWRSLGSDGGSGGGIGSFEDSVANVRDFGAVGDGSTEDSAAFKAALATGRDVYVPKGVYKITAINLSPATGQTIFGDGENTRIKTAQTDGAIFKVTNPNVKFMNLAFEGSGKTSSIPGWTTTTYQMGIWVQVQSTTITGCTFRKFNGRAVYIFHPSASYIMNNTVINNRFFQNTVGIESDYGADYLLIANNSLDSNYACLVEGGNANVYYLGNQATQSTYGYYSRGGATHGSIIGGSFNHNTTGLRIPSGQQGMTITDTKFWFSDIVLGSSDTVSRVSFYNCVVEGSNVTLTKAKNNKWVGGYIYGSSANVITGTGLTFENVITAPAGLNETYTKITSTDSSFTTKNGLNIGRGIYAPNLPTGKKLKQLYWDSGTVYVADSTGTGGGGGGSSAISSLTAAAGTNDINNADYGQIWRWNTLGSGTGLTLSTNSTGSSDAGHTLFGIDMQGANASSGQTTYAASFSNSHTGSTSTNIGLALQAYGATNNYALDLGVAGSNTGRMRLNGSASGSIVIQPASAAGTYTLTLPTTDGNSGEFLQTDGSGVLSWQPASGSGWGLTGTGATNSGTNYLGTSDNISLAIRTNATERLRIDSSGKLIRLYINNTGDYYTHGLEFNAVGLGGKGWINIDGSHNFYFSKGTGQLTGLYFSTWRNTSNSYTFTLDYQGAYTNAGTPLSAGGAPSNASAIFEANSTTKGFLMPRMTATQAEAISSPAEGLLIYSTNGTGSTITSKGWWGWDGSAWVKLN